MNLSRLALAPISNLGWQPHVPKSQHETFRWMMEKYHVQVFAKELGTARPVSVKRL